MIYYLIFCSSKKNLGVSFNWFKLFLKNVDAGAAKELMAYLVKLQSSLPEVNKYDSRSTPFSPLFLLKCTNFFSFIGKWQGSRCFLFLYYFSYVP